MLNGYETARRWLGSLRDWLLERWDLGAEPSAWMALVALGVIVVTVAVPPAWRLVRNAVTIVHEMGHVVVARLCGRRIDGIRLHSDTSGLAITRGRPRGMGMLLTALAGYPAPGLVGVAMLWAALTEHAGAALMALTVLLLAALLLVRNVWGLLILAGSLAGAGTVLWRAEAPIATLLVLVLGLFLSVGSARAAGDLLRAHMRRETDQSDAVGASRALMVLPVGVPLVFFVSVTGLCAVLGVAMIGLMLMG